MTKSTDRLLMMRRPASSLPPSPADRILLPPLLHNCSSSLFSSTWQQPVFGWLLYLCFTISGRPRPKCNHYHIFAFFCISNKEATPSPGHFIPNPSVLLGQRNQMLPPGPIVKAITPPSPMKTPSISPLNNGAAATYSGHPSPQPSAHWLTDIYLRLATGPSDQICLPERNVMMP